MTNRPFILGLLLFIAVLSGCGSKAGVASSYDHVDRTDGFRLSPAPSKDGGILELSADFNAFPSIGMSPTLNIEKRTGDDWRTLYYVKIGGSEATKATKNSFRTLEQAILTGPTTVNVPALKVGDYRIVNGVNSQVWAAEFTITK